jgi:transcriptional regulator CtsR
MVLSQRIAALIEEMLEEQGGELSLVRNELALRMGCVPSQINYVIASRFTPERGYLVESRRGGGGYIRIRKVKMSPREELMHFYHAASDSLDWSLAKVFLSDLIRRGYLTRREGALLSGALSETALSRVEREGREILRADLFKTVILQLLAEREG